MSRRPRPNKSRSRPSNGRPPSRSNNRNRSGGGRYPHHRRRQPEAEGEESLATVQLSWWKRVLKWLRIPVRKQKLIRVEKLDRFEREYLKDSYIEHLPAVFSWFPELIENLEWVNIRRNEQASNPQALLKSQHLFGTNRVFMKRESLDVDRIVDHEARKLEYLMAPVIERDSKSKVVAFAFFGSPYSLAVAQFCSMFDVRLELHLLRQPINEMRMKRLLEMKRLGVKMVFHSSQSSMDSKKKMLTRLSKFFGWTLLAFEGRDSRACLAYVSTILETYDQVAQAETPKPKRIFVPMSCGSALIGMELGKRICGWDDVQIIGVEDPFGLKVTREELAQEANALVDFLSGFRTNKLKFRFQASDFTLAPPLMLEKSGDLTFSSEKDYLKRWTARLLDLENFELDAEQSGAAFLTMVNYLEMNKVENETILFWNSFSSVKSDFLNFNLRKASFPRRVQAWKTQDEKEVRKRAAGSSR